MCACARVLVKGVLLGLPGGQHLMHSLACRRYTLPEVWHQHYSSQQVGRAMAAALASALSGGPASVAAAATADPATAAAEQLPDTASLPAFEDDLIPAARGPSALPPLADAKVVGCGLPGGWSFLYAARAPGMAAPSVVPGGRGGRALHSVSPHGLMHMLVDGEQEVGQGGAGRIPAAEGHHA